MCMEFDVICPVLEIFHLKTKNVKNGMLVLDAMSEDHPSQASFTGEDEKIF